MTGMRLYDELAAWWPLLSPPEDYAEEAEMFATVLLAHGDQPARTLLELGSGGGSNASHMRARFQETLVDLSPEMLAHSKELNPGCEHVQGDMRTLRLGRTFDRVFIHDAVCYMTSLQDLRSAVETAFVHTRPGGAALFVPDHVRETFTESTDTSGATRGGRALRYLAWVWDPDPNDTTYTVDYAYLLRDEAGHVRVEHERHLEGLFARAEWLQVLRDVGFEPHAVPLEHSEVEPGTYEGFVGVRSHR